MRNNMAYISKQVFIECLLCAKHCVPYILIIGEQTEAQRG